MPSHPTNRACTRCFDREQCIAMTALQNEHPQDDAHGDGDNDGDGDDVAGAGGLRAVDRDYINRWMECLDFEEMHSLRRNARHEMWSMDSAQRERKNGRCLAKMAISRHIQRPRDRNPHLYRFVGAERTEIAVWSLKMKIGDYVVLSEDATGSFDSLSLFV